MNTNNIHAAIGITRSSTYCKLCGIPHNLQRATRFQIAVGPPREKGMTWSGSHRLALWRQPGKRQWPSRCWMNRRMARLGR